MALRGIASFIFEGGEVEALHEEHEQQTNGEAAGQIDK